MERTQTLVAREAAANLTVAEVMLSRPKTLAATATVGELRRLFENHTLRTVLLAEGDAFVGTIEQPDVPESAADSEPARAHASATAQPVTPALLVSEAMPVVERSREGRVAVVDEDGSTLRGMLCLRRASDAFCVDA